MSLFGKEVVESPDVVSFILKGIGIDVRVKTVYRALSQVDFAVYCGPYLPAINNEKAKEREAMRGEREGIGRGPGHEFDSIV